MRITSNGAAQAPGVGGAAATTVVDEVNGPVSARPAGGGDMPLESSVLQPALAAMSELPEIDQARVAELRDAISRGELTFDASKLAGLIQRFHGSHG